MTAIRDALARYLTVRRALGTRLQEPATALGYFVDFLELQESKFITTDLALRWACQPKHVQRATWARRLTMVRQFAAWLSAFDPRTEVPPKRLLNARHQHSKPYNYNEREIDHLMIEAALLQSFRPDTPIAIPREHNSSITDLCKAQMGLNMPVRSLNSPVLKWPRPYEAKKALRKWLAKKMETHPEKVKLGYFGSLSEDNWGVGSDLDLIVIIQDSSIPFEKRPIAWDFDTLPVPTDILIYTTKE
jgi:hypothetical protein